jgi:hypothetical protein
MCYMPMYATLPWLCRRRLVYMHQAHAIEGYTAPTIGCMTAVVPSYVEVIPCRMQSCCMTHHENEIDTLMHIMQKMNFIFTPPQTDEVVPDEWDHDSRSSIY